MSHQHYMHFQRLTSRMPLLTLLLLLILGANGCSNTHTPAVENHSQLRTHAPLTSPQKEEFKSAVENHSLPINDAPTAQDFFRQGKDAEQRKDYAEALKWYRKAAESGDAQGMNSLGSMYQNGYGVVQDYAEALKWYRKSAEAGEPRGMNNLGTMYENGDGVLRDYAEALKWYRKSAEAGDTYGMTNLRNLSSYLSRHPSSSGTGSVSSSSVSASSSLSNTSSSPSSTSSRTETTLPVCSVHHDGDGAGIPCIDPYTGETTDFYDYKAKYSHDPGE